MAAPGPAWSRLVLVRSVYLAVVHVFAVLQLLSMTDRERDVEFLALRHELAILQ